MRILQEIDRNKYKEFLENHERCNFRAIFRMGEC